MNLSTSSFRYFAPLALASVVIALVEVLISISMPPVAPLLKSQLFPLGYYQPSHDARLFSAIKLEVIGAKPAEIIQVGDSSGLVGVSPEVVERETGHSYMNASMTMNAQYSGIEATARYLIRLHPEAKMLVVMLSYGMLLKGLEEGIGEDIDFYYNRWPFRLLSQLPSFRIRAPVTNVVYYGRWDTQRMLGKNLQLSDAANGLKDVFVEQRGWRPMNVPNTFPPHNCELRREDIEDGIERLDRFRRLAESHGIPLAIVIGPVQCKPDATTAVYEEMMQAYHEEYPDVLFPMGTGFTFVEPKWMNDSVHLTEEGALRYSARLGKALKEAIDKTTPASSSPGR